MALLVLASGWILVLKTAEELEYSGSSNGPSILMRKNDV